ncbi:hypothetical protein GGI07_004113 [Coemansia sp. Benny D115]|nr:hypothetical protein GGI07_004113 [Coemansia sp. Benny D115]
MALGASSALNSFKLDYVGLASSAPQPGSSRLEPLENSRKEPVGLASASNPWVVPVDSWDSLRTRRSNYRALRRVARRTRATNDPLLLPSTSDIGLYAQKVVRRAESGLLESIGDAISSPLPRSATHMVGVKADSDIDASLNGTPAAGTAVAAATAASTATAAGAVDSMQNALHSSVTSLAADLAEPAWCADGSHASPSVRGLAIKVQSREQSIVSGGGTPSRALPAHMGEDLARILSRSVDEISISEAGTSPAPSSTLGSAAVPRSIKMIRHHVSDSETLEGIAVHYGIPISQLKRLNRIWHASEIAIRSVLYVPLRLCSSKYSIPYIEYVNEQHRLRQRDGLGPQTMPIDLIEVTLEPIQDDPPLENSLSSYLASLAPTTAALRKQQWWPRVPYESIQKHFSFTL